MANFTQNERPTFKFRLATSAAAVAVWTPATSMRVGITSMTISNGYAPVGTFEVRLGNVGGNIIAAGFLGASANIHLPYESPVISDTYDRAVFLETLAGQSVNGWTICLNGFEYD
jgi:hypothetical protein